MGQIDGAVIKVIGVGGGGCNAVNRMVEAGIQGVEFVAMNTDIQVLDQSRASKKIQLGPNLSRGLGAGGDPEVGKAAAEESKNEIRKMLEGSDMVFITAGMGGGTGTGAAPVVAELSRELGAVTIAIVTRPFSFEGPKRKRMSENGVTSLIGRVDTMITIPNDRLLDVVERKTSLQDSFRVADDVLRQGVQGISDIITIPGQINVDFADVKAVMLNAGPALMGIGYGVGEHRALQAAEQATSSPLLEQTINGARGLLVNISSGEDLTLSEVSEAMEYIHGLCDPEDANIFFGTVVDPRLEGEVRITVLATGFDSSKPAPVFKSVDHAVSTPPVTAVVEVPEEPRSSASSEPTLDGRKVMNPTGSAIRDIWDRNRAAQREASDSQDVYDDADSVIDVPAFLREHRRNREK
jgi:cell division protein FtsZ